MCDELSTDDAWKWKMCGFINGESFVSDPSSMLCEEIIDEKRTIVLYTNANYTLDKKIICEAYDGMKMCKILSSLKRISITIHILYGIDSDEPYINFNMCKFRTININDY